MVSNDKLFIKLYKEYIKIIELLIDEKEVIEQKDKNLAIERSRLIELLQKNDTLLDYKKKLKFWKTFNLVVAERQRITKMAYTKDGKRKRMLVFNKKAYKMLKHFI